MPLPSSPVASALAALALAGLPACTSAGSPSSTTAAYPRLTPIALEPAPVAPESPPDIPAPEMAPPEPAPPPDPYAGLTRFQALALWNRLHGDGYALDAIDRFIEEPGRQVQCDPSGLVPYSGSVIRYAGAVRASESFVERLRRFEEVVVEAATEIYGRAPRRIRHMGVYNCRTSRMRRRRVSEHALGNAIDILGFDFGGASEEQVVPERLPRWLRGPFQVRVQRHWQREGSVVAEAHAHFLQRLIDRIVERRDVFRIVIGPGHRGHSNHFHFDMSPWHYVAL